MNKLSTILNKVVLSAAKSCASIAANSASIVRNNQPKMPEAVKDLRKF